MVGPDDPVGVKDRSWYAYVVPMVAFLAMTWLEGQLPRIYPAVYTAKVVLVAALLYTYRIAWRDIRIEARVVLPAVAVGLTVIAAWIAVTNAFPWATLGGSRAAYNPLAAIANPIGAYAFIAIRLLGLAVLVPVMEELFWRSFLIRYCTHQDWRSVLPWAFSWQAFAMVAAGFALAHPEWLAAAICAVAYGLLLRYTRSVYACVVAHATSNLALGLYVLVLRDWKFW